MSRVTGIGGIFIKAKDPAALGEWYRRHFGLDIQAWGGVTFRRHRPEAPEPEGCAVDEKTETSEYGKFGWVMDREGNKVELWNPPAGRFPG